MSSTLDTPGKSTAIGAADPDTGPFMAAGAVAAPEIVCNDVSFLKDSAIVPCFRAVTPPMPRRCSRVLEKRWCEMLAERRGAPYW
jgi:hypothetical protein